MSNARIKLSEEEKIKRREILDDLAKWKEATGSNSLVQYSQEKGLPYPYISTVAKWERSLAQYRRAKRCKSTQSFTKVANPLSTTVVNTHGVTIAIAGLSIEVNEHSSRAALATVLSVLGVSNVSGL